MTAPRGGHVQQFPVTRDGGQQAGVAGGPPEPGPQAAPPSAPATRDRAGQRVRAERRLDPAAHHIQVDSDGGQRLTIENVEQVSGTAGRHRPDQPDDLGSGPFGGYIMLAQDGGGRLVGGEHAQQQVLTADEAVAELAGL